jgi:hypothetical protein
MSNAIPEKHSRIAGMVGARTRRTLYRYLEAGSAIIRIRQFVPTVEADIDARNRGITNAALLRIAALPDDEIPAAYANARASGERRGGRRSFDVRREVQSLHERIMRIADRLDHSDILGRMALLGTLQEVQQELVDRWQLELEPTTPGADGSDAPTKGTP